MDVSLIVYCSFYGLVSPSSCPSDDLEAFNVSSALLLSRHLGVRIARAESYLNHC